MISLKQKQRISKIDLKILVYGRLIEDMERAGFIYCLALEPDADEWLRDELDRLRPLLEKLKNPMEAA